MDIITNYYHSKNGRLRSLGLIFLVFSFITKSFSNTIAYPKLKNDSTTIYVFPERLASSQYDVSVQNYETKSENSISQFPSYLPNNRGSIKRSSLTARDAETEAPDAETTTVAPVAGAIDYVLMPLIILGTAAPIFVIMYVVMGAIEFKLAPDTQVRSKDSDSSLLSGLYSLVTDTLTNVSPSLNFMYESAGRALEQDQCIENYACKIGGFCRQWGLQNYGMFSYEWLDNIILHFFPIAQQRSFRAFLQSMRKDSVDCATLYLC